MDMEAEGLLSSAETALSVSPSMFDDRIESDLIRGHTRVKISYAELDMLQDLGDCDIFTHNAACRYFFSLLHIEVPTYFLYGAYFIRLILKHIENDVDLVHADSLTKQALLLTNYACLSRADCNIVVKQGGVEILVDVIRKAQPSSELKLQCIWAISNIAAANSLTCVQRCQSTDILKLLGNTLEKEEFTSLKDMKVVILCLLNIVRDGPKLELELYNQIIRGCYNVLLKFKYNYGLVSDTIECIGFLVYDIPTDGNIILQQLGLNDTIMKFFLDEKNDHQLGCILILSRISLRVLIEEFVVTFPSFYTIINLSLKSKRKVIRLEAGRMCINIASDDVDLLFDDDEVFASLLYEACRSDFDPEIKHEAVWSLSNIITTSNEQQFQWLLQAGILYVLPHLVCLTGVRTVINSIRRLREVLDSRPHCFTLCNKLQLAENITSDVLERMPELQSLKEQLENLKTSTTNKKKPYLFVFRQRRIEA